MTRRSALLLFFCIGSPSLIAPVRATADTDVGNIAVIEADATIRQPGELFDLNGRTQTFTPRTGGGYTVSVGNVSFDTQLGDNLNLGDDASVSQPLSFTFPFFGVNRTSVFINSNGHLTFGGSSALTHFNGGTVTSLTSPTGDLSTVLDTIAEGLPRIAVLWQDWNPVAAATGGGVFARSLSDRLIVTWNAIPLFNTATTATFQVILLSTGVIQMNFQSVTSTPGGGFLTGASPGGLSQFLVTTVDFSQGSSSSISTFPNFEPLVQVFGSSSSPLVHISAVARRFYQTHSDPFDQMVLFANFPIAMGDTLAFLLPTRQTVSGIGLSTSTNIPSFFGSAGRLQSFVNMNWLGVYSDTLTCLQDPRCRIPGNNDSALTLMGQESGHQWLAFVRFDDGGVCRQPPDNPLLGRADSHWSFFLDSDASDMEGNDWRDNANGTFTTTDDTIRFSPLDQYIMGLRPAGEVPTFFFVDNPTGTTTTRSSSPQTGVTVTGTRKDVTVNQVITCEGARSLSSGFSALNTTTTWKQAFILLIPTSSTAPQADLTKIETIRAAWVSYFNSATGGRGSIDASLGTTAPTPTPSGGGGGGGVAAGGGDGGGGCFIATAAFGSPMAAEVHVLREFRDKDLLTHPPGRLLVAAYYQASPPLARLIASNEELRSGTRITLRPVIWWAGLALESPALAWSVFLLGAGSFVLVVITPFRLLRSRRPGTKLPWNPKQEV